MLLTIDIGNTNINFCVFNNNDIVYSFTLTSDVKRLEDEYGIVILNLLQNANYAENIDAVVVSSVVTQLDDVISNVIKKYLNTSAHLISYKDKMPISIKIDNPSELGADRIANASIASVEYKLPAIVIDFGTATTFDVIDDNKNFIGGLIAPGLSIQAKSLSSFTSKLPKIKIEAPKNCIATNTIDAMMSGIVTGHASMIDGMINRYEKELGKRATIIATGGLSSILTDSMERRFDFIDKNLTHRGLKLLYEINYGE